MTRLQSFDDIIVGAGSAGCVLADRLSANPDRSVLLIEAGGKDRNPLFRLPMLMGKLFHSGICIHNWRYHTEPVPSLDGRSLYWPRGSAGRIVDHRRHDLRAWQSNRLRPLDANGPSRLVLRRGSARLLTL